MHILSGRLTTGLTSSVNSLRSPGFLRYGFLHCFGFQQSPRLLHCLGFICAAFLAGMASQALAQSASDCQDSLDCESAWLGISAAQRQDVFAFAEEYKAFIHRARTELSFVREAVAFAEANGFQPWNEQSSPAPGGQMDESLVFFRKSEHILTLCCTDLQP